MDPGQNPQYTAWVAPSCAANTAATAFTKTAVGLTFCFLWTWEVRIPPGHAGVTGIALLDSNTFILPFEGTTAAWLIGDDDLLRYPYELELGANVQLATYNTSTLYTHGWQCRFVYTPMSALDNDQAVIVTPNVADYLAG